MSVSISIDGEQDTHDALRGARGSHAAALAAMGHLAGEGVQVSANSQIGRRNRHELPCIFERIAAAGAHSWQIQITVAAGRVADDPALLLEPYHMLEVLPAVARLQASAASRDLRIWPGNNLGYYGPFEAALRGNLPGGRRGSCGAGRVLVGIEANGALKACPSLPSEAYVGGNVRDTSLRDVWERAEPLRFTRDERASELWGHCASCYYAEDCLGGCSWTAHSLFGRRGNNPFCHHRALELLGRGRRERLVRTVPAGVRPSTTGASRSSRRTGPGTSSSGRARSRPARRPFSSTARHREHPDPPARRPRRLARARRVQHERGVRCSRRRSGG